MATNSTGNSATKTISMEPGMAAESAARARALGFRSYSSYVQALVRDDLRHRRAIVHSEAVSSSPSHSAGSAAEKIPLAKHFEEHHQQQVAKLSGKSKANAAARRPNSRSGQVKKH